MSAGRPHYYGHLLQVQKEFLTLIHIFSWLNKCISCRSGADNPRGQNFDVNRNLLSLQSFATIFKRKTLWSLILYNFFHNFIHVYSPRARTDNPFGTKFWCQQEHLVTSVICCKFQKNLFEVWFIQFFSWFYTSIQPWGRGRQPPGDKVFMSTEMPCHFIHLLQVSKKMSLKSDFIQFIQQKCLVTSVICC